MSTLKWYIYVGRSIFSDTNLINKIILHPTKPDIHWRNTKGWSSAFKNKGQISLAYFIYFSTFTKRELSFVFWSYFEWVDLSVEQTNVYSSIRNT